MLQVGSAKLTETEAKSHFASWCISSAPLILGYNLVDPAASARAQHIVGCQKAIEVNQAWSGHAGGVISQSAETFSADVHHGAGDGGGGNASFPLWQVWAKPISTAAKALLLLNISPEPRDISVAGLAAGTMMLVDVWTGETVNHTGSTYTAKMVPGHGSVFLIATAVAAS
jgi:hypothetical protein